MPKDGDPGPKGDNAQMYVLNIVESYFRVLPDSGSGRLVEESVSGTLEFVDGSERTLVDLRARTDIHIRVMYDNGKNSVLIGETGGSRYSDGFWSDDGKFSGDVYGGTAIGSPKSINVWVYTYDSNGEPVTLTETYIPVVMDGEKGEKGDDSVSYTILTDRDHLRLTDDNVQVHILVTEGKSVTDVGLYTAKNTYGLSMTATLGGTDISSLVKSSSASYSEISGFSPKMGQILDMKLWKGSQLVARKTMYVTSDGVLGKLIYPAGVYSDDVTYTSTNKSAPMVQLDGLYYYLEATTSVKGVNPATDVANKGGNWALMDTIKAQFVEILMADFAKLASAVFSGDYMFSQYGIDSNGNVSKDYQKFAEGTFTPNLWIDFLNGKFRCADADVCGTITAKSVKVPMVELRLTENVTLDFATQGKVLHLKPEVSQWTVTLPKASLYKLQEITLYVSPVITRSSLTCDIYSQDTAGFYWNFRGLDYADSKYMRYTLPYGTMTKLVSLQDNTGNWTWYISNVVLNNLSSN